MSSQITSCSAGLRGKASPAAAWTPTTPACSPQPGTAGSAVRARPRQRQQRRRPARYWLTRSRGRTVLWVLEPLRRQWVQALSPRTAPPRRDHRQEGVRRADVGGRPPLLRFPYLRPRCPATPGPPGNAQRRGRHRGWSGDCHCPCRRRARWGGVVAGWAVPGSGARPPTELNSLSVLTLEVHVPLAAVPIRLRGCGTVQLLLHRRPLLRFAGG